MADPGTPENSHDKKFVPAFIDFIAVGIVGVAIHQLVHNDYSSGIALSGISIFLFLLAFYWSRLATRLPSRMSQTALSAALDFRWWVGAQELSLQEGYIISLIDGERISMKVNTNPFPDMNINEAAPVPANCVYKLYRALWE